MTRSLHTVNIHNIKERKERVYKQLMAIQAKAIVLGSFFDPDMIGKAISSMTNRYNRRYGLSGHYHKPHQGGQE